MRPRRVPPKFPQGFEWRDNASCVALYLDGQMVAYVTTLDSGWARVMTNPNLLVMRTVFLADTIVGRRYVDA